MACRARDTHADILKDHGTFKKNPLARIRESTSTNGYGPAEGIS